MEDLPLGRIAALVHEFYSEGPALGRNIDIYIYIFIVWSLDLIVFSEKDVSYCVLFTSCCLYR